MNGTFRESKSVTNRTQLFNCVKRKKGEIKVIIEAGRVSEWDGGCRCLEN